MVLTSPSKYRLQRSYATGTGDRHHDKTKVMTLGADEFIRRFMLHVIPSGFHRIHHYGFFVNGQRAAKLVHARPVSLEAQSIKSRSDDRSVGVPTLDPVREAVGHRKAV